MSRRAFLCAAVTSCLPLSSAQAIGSWGGSDLAVALSEMRGITSGPTVGPRVDVLLSPGCDKASRFVPLVLSVPDVRWRFVPFDPRPSFDSAVGRFIREGGRDSVLDFCLSSSPSEVRDSDGATQRVTYDTRLGVALYRATGRTPAAPSMVADLDADGFRVFRGAPDEGEFAEILAYLRTAVPDRPWDAFPALFPERG